MCRALYDCSLPHTPRLHSATHITNPWLTNHKLLSHSLSISPTWVSNHKVASDMDINMFALAPGHQVNRLLHLDLHNRSAQLAVSCRVQIHAACTALATSCCETKHLCVNITVRTRPCRNTRHHQASMTLQHHYQAPHTPHEAHSQQKSAQAHTSGIEGTPVRNQHRLQLLQLCCRHCCATSAKASRTPYAQATANHCCCCPVTAVPLQQRPPAQLSQPLQSAACWTQCPSAPAATKDSTCAVVKWRHSDQAYHSW